MKDVARRAILRAAAEKNCRMARPSRNLPPGNRENAAHRRLTDLREVGMVCPNCRGEDRTLYRVPVASQLGSVPIVMACFFCYLKITGGRPPSAELVPGSSVGSHF